MRNTPFLSSLHRPMYASRTLISLLALWAVSASCSVDHGISYMTDDAWLKLGQTEAVGALFEPKEVGSGTLRRLRNLGYVRLGLDVWRREVQLDKQEEAWALGANTLTNIDAIGILSIDRHNGAEPYIYDTLQSLFSELPQGSVVNVFVGDDDAEYVSLPVLTKKIGATWAQQVHVIGTDKAIADHFRKHRFTLIERSTWNYARVMRAYRGSKHYLVTEDDVAWGQRSVAYLDHMLNNPQPPVITAYNWRCDKLPGGSSDAFSDIEILSMPLHWYHQNFSGTQAMLFSAKHNTTIGNHLLLHTGRRPYDLEMDAFLRARDLHIGVTQPSMVQHQGVKTTGLGSHHTSKCFRLTFPEPK